MELSELSDDEWDVYIAENRHQLEKWAQGVSIHLAPYDQCVPDESCCKPHLAWPLNKRVRYFMSSEEVQQSMLTEHDTLVNTNDLDSPN